MIFLDMEALQIVKRLTDAGHIAYYAGGWVRDYLMGHPSSDIDIASSASPEEIMALFPHTVPVGIAFGVVIVIAHGKQFEVATFRRDVEYLHGRKPSRIEPSTPEEDASRRDFTINGMFYDPLTDTLYDYVGGQEDLKKQLIRTIGNPFDRFYEDRLRMIRAVRFASRFGFHIDPATLSAIQEVAPLLFPAVSMERVSQELNKMAEYPSFDHSLVEMHSLGLLGVIFPELKELHLNEIKERVSYFRKFPEDTPTIGYLMQLFTNLKPEKIENLCKHLKLSKRDLQFALFLQAAEKEEIGDLQEWSHFYANPLADLSLRVIAAKRAKQEADLFLQEHAKRKSALDIHVERIRDKKPLVTATHLQKAGVVPGKEMGELLFEAERLSILHGIINPDEIIAHLKEKRPWKK